jgi:hypothetical protein
VDGVRPKIDAAPAARASECDVLIGTGKGPQSNFDGPGGTLAWACMPDGRDSRLMLRFDDDETWTLDPMQRGVVVSVVAAHEIGHVLGLDHAVGAAGA